MERTIYDEISSEIYNVIIADIVKENVRIQEAERGQWDSKMDFILSCLGYAVGLGNVWRFPYLCYRNGGGAFLIPYLIMLTIAGMPLFFFEISFGQFASLGPTAIWKVVPLFKGVGFGMILITTMVLIYYNVIIMYSVYYMLVSFISLEDGLPWRNCNNAWNTEFCISEWPNLKGMNESQRLKASFLSLNATCVNETLDKWDLSYSQLTYNIIQNDTLQKHCSINHLLKTPSNEYWTYQVLHLQKSDGIGDLGSVSVKLVFCLLLTWIVVFFCLIKGIKTSGKVVYFTATFPYVMLFVLLIRGVTLPGHLNGIRFYMIPDWKRLADLKVWSDAATQIFFSLGPAFGSLITVSSYNKFNNNCHRDALVIGVLNSITSIFAGFVIFAFLGFMSVTTNRSVSDVATGGPGLVFVVYPEGLAQMPVSSLWSFLFFFMIVTLGLDTQFTFMETVISSISDEFPNYFRNRKVYLTLFCCCVFFFVGIPCVTRGGIYVLTLMDWYCGSYGLMIVCLAELVAIMYIYGFPRFCRDIEMMVGFEPSNYWKVNWFAITPATIVFILLAAAVNNSKARYGSYIFEDWAQAIGWIAVALPLVAIFGTMIYFVAYFRINNLPLKDTLKPDVEWGPALDQNRTSPYIPLKFMLLRKAISASEGGPDSAHNQK